MANRDMKIYWESGCVFHESNGADFHSGFTSKYAAGTMNTVSTTETANPPMMARANGAYASLPVPSFMAIGSNPTTVAKEVTRMGRNWLRHARETASRNGRLSSRSRLVNSTMRMLLDTTIPTTITTPINDITLRVVPVTNSISNTPVNPVGTASKINSGSVNDLNCATRIK